MAGQGLLVLHTRVLPSLGVWSPLTPRITGLLDVCYRKAQIWFVDHQMANGLKLDGLSECKSNLLLKSDGDGEGAESWKRRVPR